MIKYKNEEFKKEFIELVRFCHDEGIVCEYDIKDIENINEDEIIEIDEDDEFYFELPDDRDIDTITIREAINIKNDIRDSKLDGHIYKGEEFVKSENSIISYIDIAKALGIILVVCGHMGGAYKAIGLSIYSTKPNEIFPLYSFHMPLFIFISGYFYKVKYILDIKSQIKKRFYSLVLPYYKWNLFYGILVSILIYFNIFQNGKILNLYNFFIEPLFQGYQYNLNGPSWFILSLFSIQIGYTLINKLLKSKSFICDTLLIIILFIFTVLVNLWSNNINMVQYPIALFISRTTFGIFFFHLGYYFNTYIKTIYKLGLINLIIIIIVKYSLNIWLGKNYTFSMRTMLLRGESIIPIVWAILGILYILNLSKLLEIILTKHRIKYIGLCFNFLANNTFAIMMHHMTINYFIVFLMNYFGKNTSLVLAWLSVSNIVNPILCIVFSIYFEKYVGKLLNKIYTLFFSKFNSNTIQNSN